MVPCKVVFGDQIDLMMIIMFCFFAEHEKRFLDKIKLAKRIKHTREENILVSDLFRTCFGDYERGAEKETPESRDRARKTVDDLY